jgi:site-specific DNA-methyltransferase (adenine-specific)
MSLPKPYYQDESCTIYHGDCREILPHLEPVDLVLTDPPYGVNFSGKVTKHTVNTKGYESTIDDSSIIIDVVLPAVSICKTLSNRIVITPGSRNMFKYPEPDCVCAIYYPSGAGLGKWGFTCWQPIFYYGKDPYISKGLGSRPDSFSTTVSAEKNGHPCPKPIQTMKWLVHKSSFETETILDPFMGSGTTLRAAKDLGRKAIGIELEEKYCEVAAKRLRQEVFSF